MKIPSRQNLLLFGAALILLGAGVVMSRLNNEPTSQFDNRYNADVSPNPSTLPTVTESPQEDVSVVNDELRGRILADISNDVNCGLNSSTSTDLTTPCTVDKVAGNYAKGTMPLAYWIAVNQDQRWKVVITGNGIPQCSDVDTYEIPIEIYGACLDDAGELR